MSVESKRLRILIPVLGFGRAGGHRVLSELANAWIDIGHDVAFACPATSDIPYFPTKAEIYWLGHSGERVEWALNEGETGAANLRSLFFGTKRLHNSFDIILTNHSLTPWPILLSGVPRTKRFYYIQAYEPEYYALEKRPLLWLASRFSYALPFTQIANASIYKHAFVRPVSIIPFGINLNVFKPKVQTSRQAGAPLTIGCIGRSEPQKGTPYVLEAFERLYASDPRHRLRIAYGNVPEGWSHEAAEIIVPSNDVELAAFYRSLDVLVAAGTVQHGAPHYPALEALASGASLVTTGFEPATAENAWLVPNRDPNGICEALRLVSEYPHDALRKTSIGLQDVQPFAWTEVAERAISVFQNGR